MHLQNFSAGKKNIASRLVLAVAAMLLVLTYTPAGASPVAYVDSAVAVSGNGSSWATAFKTVQEALTAAGTDSNITAVWIRKGTYYPTAVPQGAVAYSLSIRDYAFKMKSHLAIYGGFAGTETAVSQRTPGNVTTLSGDIGNANIRATTATM